MISLEMVPWLSLMILLAMGLPERQSGMVSNSTASAIWKFWGKDKFLGPVIARESNKLYQPEHIVAFGRVRLRAPFTKFFEREDPPINNLPYTYAKEIICVILSLWNYHKCLQKPLFCIWKSSLENKFGKWVWEMSCGHKVKSLEMSYSPPILRFSMLPS